MNRATFSRYFTALLIAAAGAALLIYFRVKYLPKFTYHQDLGINILVSGAYVYIGCMTKVGFWLSGKSNHPHLYRFLFFQVILGAAYEHYFLVYGSEFASENMLGFLLMLPLIMLAGILLSWLFWRRGFQDDRQTRYILWGGWAVILWPIFWYLLPW